MIDLSVTDVLAAATLDGTVKNLIGILASALGAVMLFAAACIILGTARNRKYADIFGVLGVVFIVAGLLFSGPEILTLMKNTWNKI